jgi:hypothetical protein
MLPNGQAPSSRPWLAAFFRGNQARTLMRAAGPAATLVVNDSARLPLGAATVGEYQGPDFLLLLPVGVELSPQAFLAIARARTVVLEFDTGSPPLRVRVAEADRHDIASLYIVSVCGAPPAPAS